MGPVGSEIIQINPQIRISKELPYQILLIFLHEVKESSVIKDWETTQF